LAGFCEQGYETCGSTKGVKFADELSYYQLLNKDRCAMDLLVNQSVSQSVSQSAI